MAALSLLLVAQVASGQVRPESALVVSVSAGADYVDTRRDRGRDETGLVVNVRPGVVYTSQTGRLRGRLSYTPEFRYDTARARGGEIVHDLDAVLTAEAIDNWAFIDASASIAQRPVSAFGVQVEPSSPRDTGNREEVVRVRLRPHVRGVLGELASYNVGVFAAASRTGNSRLGDVNESGGDFALSSLGGGLLGWGVNGSRQRVEFLAGRATVDERLVAAVNLRPDVDWFFTLRAGQESSDVATLDKRRYDTWGGGLRWTPSPRTLLSADLDERYFGRSWAVVLEHRLALSALRFTSTRAASTSRGAEGGGITLYDLLFAQLTSVQPDPGLRDLLVRDILRELQADATTRVPGGSLSNSVSLQRRTALGWTYNGARLTLALQAFVSDSEAIDTRAPQLGDGRVSQRGLVANGSWRLTPTTRASVSVSRLETASNELRAGNDLHTVALTASDRIGLRTTASVTARLSRQSGGPDPYRESAIGASLSHRF